VTVAQLCLSFPFFDWQVRMWEMITFAMASLGAAAQAGASWLNLMLPNLHLLKQAPALPL
jgi:hypothetical protein